MINWILNAWTFPRKNYLSRWEFQYLFKIIELGILNEIKRLDGEYLFESALLLADDNLEYYSESYRNIFQKILISLAESDLDDYEFDEEFLETFNDEKEIQRKASIVRVDFGDDIKKTI